MKGEQLPRRDDFADEMESKGLKAHSEKVYEREALRELYQQGKISERDFKTQEAELTRIINEILEQNERIVTHPKPLTI